LGWAPGVGLPEVFLQVENNRLGNTSGSILRGDFTGGERLKVFDREANSELLLAPIFNQINMSEGESNKGSNEKLLDDEQVKSDEVPEDVAADTAVYKSILSVLDGAHSMIVEATGELLISAEGAKQVVMGLIEAGEFYLVMRNINKFAGFPFVKEVFEEIVARDPKVILTYSRILKEYYGEADVIIEKAVRDCIKSGERDAGAVFEHVELLKDLPDVKELLLLAAAEDSWMALKHAQDLIRIVGQPCAKEVVLLAVEHSSESTFGGDIRKGFDDNLDLPFAIEFFSAIARKWPMVILQSRKFNDVGVFGWCNDVVNIALDHAAETFSVELLKRRYCVPLLNANPEVLERIYRNALKEEPVHVLEEKSYTLKSLPYAREMFMEAIEEGGVAVSEWFVVNFDSYQDEEEFASDILEAGVRRVLTGPRAADVLLDEKVLKDTGEFPWAEDVYSALAREKYEKTVRKYGSYADFEWGRRVFDIAVAVTDDREPIKA
jgi:hypothetical protein